MNILSLDLATETGWALHANGIRSSGSIQFNVRRGESPGIRFVRFRKWLADMAFGPKVPKLDLVVYEMAHHRGGAATAVGVGFATVVLEFCAQFEIEHTGVHTATLKKFATGKGNATKDDVIRCVNEKFGEPGVYVDNDNEADAIALLEYARATMVPVA